MYGETEPKMPVPDIVKGLSPHVRGNPLSLVDREGLPGSIPACTGKPFSEKVLVGVFQVYPRMYGETRMRYTPRSRREGLSPHVRGNLDKLIPHLPVLRSIPACTGKPRATGPTATCCGVYPRMYGETRREFEAAMKVLGLSPHVRGNPPPPGSAKAPSGSIPACTGKPC